MIRRLVPFALAIAAHAASPWTPTEGQLTLTGTYVHEGFRTAWAGPNQFQLPSALGLNPKITFLQNTGLASLEYGLSDRVAFDLVTGFSRTSFNNQTANGSADTSLGLRIQAARGENAVFTLRFAGIIPGSYPLSDRLGPFNPGDKVWGTLGSAIVGVTLPKGFYTFGEAGYKYRQKPAPNAFFGNAGIGHRVKGFSYGVSYQHNRSLAGIDIFAPGFTPLRFDETQQTFGTIDLNAGFTTSTGVYFGVDWGHTLFGRNVGNKNIVAVTVGFTFPRRGPHF